MSKFFVFIVATVVLNAASQLLMKTGMNRVGQAEFSASHIWGMALAALTNPFILLGLTTMTISMGTHLLSLSRFDVSFAFPFISLAYVVVAVWGYAVLGENVNLTRMLGILTIILGTALIARS